ncbi:MAG: methyltransferase domain-containing protein [Treponema sp.]|nr:methyltransferase domain-containing protein [Treponema sp.]
MNREQKTVNSEDYSQQPILIVPACEKGRGGGHLVRCIALANGLKTLGREAFLFIPEIAGINCLVDDIFIDKTVLLDKTGLQGKNWEFVILDRYQTQPEELAQWAKLAPVIGIDEGGSCRNSFDFLIDLLPNCSPVKPNIADPSLLPLPSKKIQLLPHPEPAPFRILISFGLEDAAGLGSAAAQVLAVKNNGNAEITLPRSLIPNLSEHLAEFDLVITHFGLTAFEALYAGVPVLLVSPGKYHEKLAKMAGFISAGIGKRKADKLGCMLFKKGIVNHRFLQCLKKRCAALTARYNLNETPMQSLAELVHNFQPAVNRDCPVCARPLMSDRGKWSGAIARFSKRTYRRCKHCGVINMSRLTPPPIVYGKEYFFEDYQKQYGKTYIEDFPNLTAMAKRRLAVIQSKREKEKGKSEYSLLDIGCAYGPFLAAARDAGFSPFGIDPSEDAVRYVTQTLGIPAVQGFFPPTPCSSPLTSCLLPFSFSAVTLWYVIEHFNDCRSALAEIQTLLEAGKGVLAFATPSFSGISGRISLIRFLERSPPDHWTVWSPSSCRKALMAAGFKAIKIKSCGHHPERFPFIGKLAQNRKSPLYWLLFAISVIFSLGDSFEVYAEH